MQTYHRVLYILLLTGTLLGTSCTDSEQASGPAGHQMIVLGFDGMDPRLAREMLDEGRLPNFAKLARQGGFKPLGTSTPPQSPVAWSSLITGTDPGKHGIFDFIHRDPSTYLPYASTTRTEESSAWYSFSLPLGDCDIPMLGGAKVINLRHGTPFWEYLTRAGINAHVYRMPANYPPEKPQGAGEFLTLTDMGTPDLKGSTGEFSFYTTGSFKTSRVSGGKVYRPIPKGDVIKSSFFGPPDMLLEEDHKNGKNPLEVAFTVYRDPKKPNAVIEWQSNRVLLKQGEWSEWQTVEFDMGPCVGGVNVSSLPGSFRMYLKQVRPTLQLYVTPIQVDPFAPALPIGYPDDFATQVASKVGRYFSQGLPEDTKALTHDVLNRDEFLQQAELVFQERLKLLDYALDRYRDGFLFFYFGSTDQVAHMFWGAMVDEHPAITPEERRLYHDEVRKTYQKADAALGKVMARFPDATLLCVSDHGFMSFSKGFNLNTWLMREGYLTLKMDRKTRKPRTKGKDIMSIDFKKSKAYAIGINGLYINLRGRERQGIVSPIEKQKLMDEIAAKLRAIRDPRTGDQVIKEVYQSHKVYSADHLDVAPDMQVGYGVGYRGSWGTALGGTPEELIELNKDAWCGDHCVATDLVPGVVFSNRPIKLESPTLEDIAPTILSEFELEIPKQMKGGSLFTKREQRLAGGS